MSQKRPHEPETDGTVKKRKHGFSVGPANLPDGTYRRKVQKIKQGLIENAKIKKDYAAVKKRDSTLAAERSRSSTARADVIDEAPTPGPNLELHPDRLALLHNDRGEGAEDEDSNIPQHQASRQRKPRERTNPYTRQLEKAEERRVQADQRRREREAAEQERQRKREDRERWRRQIAKARQPGKDGKRRLGRESKVLYEKVKRMVEADKA